VLRLALAGRLLVEEAFVDVPEEPVVLVDVFEIEVAVRVAGRGFGDEQELD
jgi:hypothetical protein